jgi:hypothetical protein
MPQEIGEIYKSLIPSLSDGASIEEAFQMYHYGTSTYNGNNLQPQSVERHLIDLNEDVSRIDQTIASLTNIYIEETSTAERPNSIVSQEGAVVPLTIRGVFGQSVPLQRWQRNTGTANTDVALINNNGSSAFAGYLSVGSAVTSATTGLSLTLAGDHKGLTIKKWSTQTENMQEWQDSSGSIISKIDSSGDFTSPNIYSTNITSVGIGFFAEMDVSGTLDVTGNVTVVADISANNISASTDIIVGADLDVIGTTTTKSIDADGTISSTGKITSNGDIEALGSLIGVDLQLSQNLLTSGNIVANGIIKVKSPNEGTTGALRILADDVNQEGYLQFVGSDDSTEFGYIKSTLSELFISQNTSVDGTLNISSPTQFNTVVGTTTASLGARQVYLSAGDADDTVGANGDIWIKYV